jgi:hypothetical protein
VGVGQIITNIKKLLNDENKYDDGFDKNKNQTYPILVTYDSMFDTPGLNRILLISFFRELRRLKDEELDVTKVKPLIIVNIDTLIQVTPLLRNGIVSLKELCEAFYAHFQVKPIFMYQSEEDFVRAYQESLLSFSDYIPHYLTSKLGAGWQSEELLHYLFNKAGTEY